MISFHNPLIFVLILLNFSSYDTFKFVIFKFMMSSPSSSLSSEARLASLIEDSGYYAFGACNLCIGKNAVCLLDLSLSSRCANCVKGHLGDCNATLDVSKLSFRC